MKSIFIVIFILFENFQVKGNRYLLVKVKSGHNEKESQFRWLHGSGSVPDRPSPPVQPADFPGSHSLAKPPKFLSVKSWNVCLAKTKKDSAATLCLPHMKPPQCPRISWMQIQKIFQGEKCPRRGSHGQSQSSMGPQIISEAPVADPYLPDAVSATGVSSALPPAYLRVRNWQLCLETTTGGGSSALCLPSAKPLQCPETSWYELQQVFRGEKCPGSQNLPDLQRPPELPSPLPGVPSATAPTYLSVPNWQLCLGTKTSPVQSSGASFLCMPSVKPLSCPHNSWSELQQVFRGDSCPTAQRPGVQPAPLPGGQSSIPPAYLGVAYWQSCLGTKMTSVGYGGTSVLCLPAEKPFQCPGNSWNQLRLVFKGEKCSEVMDARPPPQFEVLPAPVTTSKLADSPSQWPLPVSVPDDLTEEVQTFETRPPHIPTKLIVQKPTLEVLPPPLPGGPTALPPAYLKVPNWELCLGTTLTGGPRVGGTAYCLPPAKPAQCPQMSWYQMRRLFDGEKCPQNLESVACDSEKVCTDSNPMSKCHRVSGGRGYCVPMFCDENNVCPPVGHVYSGVIHGTCDSEGNCEYDPAIAIA